MRDNNRHSLGCTLSLTACLNINLYFGSSNGGAIHFCFKFLYADGKRMLLDLHLNISSHVKKAIIKEKQCLIMYWHPHLADLLYVQSNQDLLHKGKL